MSGADREECEECEECEEQLTLAAVQSSIVVLSSASCQDVDVILPGCCIQVSNSVCASLLHLQHRCTPEPSRAEPRREGGREGGSALRGGGEREREGGRVGGLERNRTD